MKFFTRDYLSKKKFVHSLSDYKSTDVTDFKTLYKSELERYLNQAEISFNTPIKMIETRDEIIKTYQENKYPIYDFSTKRIIGYSTLEDILKKYDAKKEKLEQDFINRGEFDREKSKKAFFKIYQMNFDTLDTSLMKKYLSDVDIRILALGYIPSMIYLKTQTQIESYKTEINEIENEYNDIHSSILDDVIKLNQRVIAIEKDKDINIFFKLDGLLKSGNTGLTKLSFKNISNVTDFNFKKIDYSSLLDEMILSFEVYKKEKYHVEFLFKESELSFDFASFEVIENYNPI